MCHNHSHIAASLFESVETDQLEVRTLLPVRGYTVEMPTGERLILSRSTVLFALSPPPGTHCSPELLETVAHSIVLYVAARSVFASAQEIPLFLKTGL